MNDDLLDDLDEVESASDSIEVPRHSGDPQPPLADFFRPPPAEIGRLMTAETTLTTEKHPMALGARWILIGGLMLGTYFGLKSLFSMGVAQVGPALDITCAGAGLLLGFITWLMTRFKHTCSYVGHDGVVRYRISGSRDSQPREELFLFNQARYLHTAETHNYYNGVYTGTTYDFRWTDEGKQRMFRLNGSYRSKHGTPKPKDPYHFAKMAEIAWSMFLLEAAQAELESKGFVEFIVNRKDIIRVGPGFMEFLFKGKTERVPVSEMKDISINAGWFSFKTNEARMFSSKGKFSFQYGQMGNARLFLLCLDTLAGIRFS